MITRYETTNLLSKVLVANGFVFVSGLTAKDRSGDVAAQTADILAQIDSYLAMAGTDKSRLVKCNIWLKDISKFKEMNAVWEAWADKDALPSRATVESRLASDNVLVEIQAQAVV